MFVFSTGACQENLRLIGLGRWPHSRGMPPAVQRQITLRAADRRQQAREQAAAARAPEAPPLQDVQQPAVDLEVDLEGT